VQAEHDLWRAVEAGDEVRGDLVIVAVGRRAEVTHLEQVVLIVDDDVVRLQVGVPAQGQEG